VARALGGEALATRSYVIHLPSDETRPLANTNRHALTMAVVLSQEGSPKTLRTTYCRTFRHVVKITFVVSVVVLALAVMVMALGVVFVAGLQLGRALSSFSSSARASASRIQPLADELEQGAAVTAAELEALAQSMQRLTTSRRTRSRRSR
jgi:hypothetical protein